jgi:protein-S-isoprenylcysteine O-methyltransferase Ste14
VGFDRSVTLWAWGLTALAFADAPWLTVRQVWVAKRSRARARLLTTELTLIAAWAGATAAGWRPRLVPEPWPPLAGVLGAAVAVMGLGLSVWGKLRLGRWFSATFGVKEGHELITGGPYGVTRHPIYSGLLIGLAGTAVTWNLALLLWLGAALSATLYGHTFHEEALFTQHFGDAYRRYQRRVPRLVPFTRGRGRE